MAPRLKMRGKEDISSSQHLNSDIFHIWNLTKGILLQLDSQ
jgi:hypothetical protein